MNTTELIVEMRPEKIQARTGFEPMTSEYDFHISTIIIYHLDGLFGTNIMTCSQLAC